MAIVYLHRRIDTGEPFYVGIGKTEKRAYETNRSRSDFWKSIINKHPFEVDIVKRNISWKDAIEIEKLLIEYYGRRDLDRGPLCNLTDGGEGSTGKKLSLKSIDKMGSTVYQYTLDGVFVESYPSIRYAARKLGFNHRLINATCNGGQKTHGGFIWLTDKSQLKDRLPKVHKRQPNVTNIIPVLQYDLNGNFIAEYRSGSEAFQKTGIYNIPGACKGVRNQAGGFIWKYKNKK